LIPKQNDVVVTEGLGLTVAWHDTMKFDYGKVLQQTHHLWVSTTNVHSGKNQETNKQIIFGDMSSIHVKLMMPQTEMSLQSHTQTS
jgi:hypothetical protein